MTAEIRSFLIIVLILSLGQITADIYLPAFPAIAHDLHVDINAVQFSLSLYMLGFGLSQLFYGPVSDALGRKKPLVFGLILCLIGSIICGITSSINIFSWGRLLQGLGAGATLTIGGAVMRDLFEQEKLAQYGSYGTLISIALLATAPLFGSYLLIYGGWRAIFIFLIIYSFLLLLAISIMLPETNRFKKREHLQFYTFKNNLRELTTSRIFIGYTICSLLAYGALLSWLTAGPVVLLEHVGITPVAYGWIYTLTGVAFAMGAFMNSQLVTKLGMPIMLHLGIYLLLTAGIIMLAFSLAGFMNTLVIIGPVFIVLLAASLIFPNASASLLQPFPHIAGLASALFYGFRLLGGAIASAVIAIFANNTQTPMALAFIITGCMSLVVLYLINQFPNENKTLGPDQRLDT